MSDEPNKIRIISAGELRKRDLDELRSKFNVWVQGVKGGKAFIPFEFTSSRRWAELEKEIKEGDFGVYHYDGECLPEYANKWEISW